MSRSRFRIRELVCTLPRGGILGSTLFLLCQLGFSPVAAQTQTPSSANKTIQVSSILDENAAPGSIVETLANLFPDLSNFRLSTDNRSNEFAVENTSGRIVVSDGADLDYESRTLHSLVIQADVIAAPKDPFLDQFADALLDEGVTSDRLDQLRTSTRTITVRIRLRNVAEATRLNSSTLETADPPNDDLPIEAAQTGSASPSINHPDISGITESVTRSIESPRTASGATATDQNSSREPLATATLAADLLSGETTDIVADPPPMPLTDLTDTGKSRTPIRREQPLKSAGMSAKKESANVLVPESGNSPSESNYVRDLVVFILVLSTAGFFLNRKLRQATEARMKALREKEEDEANRRAAAVSIQDVPCTNLSEEAPRQSHSDAVDSKKIVDSDNKGQPVASTHDPESLFSDEYFTETELPAVVSAAKTISPEFVRKLQLEIVERDSMILDLQDKLTAAGDPRKNLSQAREDLERILDRHMRTPSEKFSTSSPEMASAIVAGISRNLEMPAEDEGDHGDLSAPQSQPILPEAKPDPESDPESAERPEEMAVASARSPEETHLDSVAQYLSNLLERSGKGDSDEIFVDRRKSGGRWEGPDKRVRPKPTQPVKSYIEAYLTDHGGQVHQNLPDLKQLQSTNKPAPVEEVPAAVVRTPVDVLTIRAHMTSFREVAFRSVENALAAYNQRQAKIKLAWRSLLVAALIFVTILVLATNTAKAMHFNSLNWLMGTAVLLTVAELCLRAQSIRRYRKTLRLHVLDPQRNCASAKALVTNNEQQPVPASLVEQPFVVPENSNASKEDRLLLSLS